MIKYIRTNNGDAPATAAVAATADNTMPAPRRNRGTWVIIEAGDASATAAVAGAADNTVPAPQPKRRNARTTNAARALASACACDACAPASAAKTANPPPSAPSAETAPPCVIGDSGVHCHAGVRGRKRGLPVGLLEPDAGAAECYQGGVRCELRGPRGDVPADDAATRTDSRRDAGAYRDILRSLWLRPALGHVSTTLDARGQQ